MEENENNDNSDQLEIIMNMNLKKKNSNYLFIIASNKTRDYAIMLIQKLSCIYAVRYILEDFQKINFFKNYNYNLSQCIDIMINIFNEKKDLIMIEEEENKQMKISLYIQINVNGLNIRLGEEKIEIVLLYDDVDSTIKNSLIWLSALFLFQEKEEYQKLKIKQENEIQKLNQEISELKIIIEHLKLGIRNSFKDNNINNNNEKDNNDNNVHIDFNKSSIVNNNNITFFDIIKQKIKDIYKRKKIGFRMIYNAKENGDSSQKFHELCDNINNTLVIVNTTTKNIFGGFASKTWNSMELGRKKDDKSFIFSINKQKIYNPKIDDPERQRYHLFCSDNDGPCFYAFSIDNLFFKNGGYCDEIEKCNYDFFENNYEINNGEKRFQVKQLEIYEIVFTD